MRRRIHVTRFGVHVDYVLPIPKRMSLFMSPLLTCIYFPEFMNLRVSERCPNMLFK